MTTAKRRRPSTLKTASGRSKRGRTKWGFLVIWQLQVRAGMEKRFEKIYGAQGDWVQLFTRDHAYIATELLREPNSTSYLTLDYWTSKAAYDAFRKQHRAEYKAIDLMCAGMTTDECEVGRFVKVDSE